MVRRAALARLPLLLMGMVALVTGVLAGLARLGAEVPALAAAQAGTHGALMIAGFLGTVISLERAVALASSGLHWPYVAPFAAGLGGVSLLAGVPIILAHALFVSAGLVLAFGSTLLFFRRRAAYLATLALGALAWLGGNLVWALDGSLLPAVPWWIAFLVLTIAGERLELTRFLPTTLAAQRWFNAIVAVQVVALPLGLWREGLGLALFAFTLIALALWLLGHDIARRTVKQAGLTRYIAVCLLSGYAWLAFGGALGLLGGFAPGSMMRDAALHAIFLGFVFAMIFGHAPIIIPAVANVKLPYHPVFYVPLVLLHLTVTTRIVGDLANSLTAARQAAISNSLTLLLFVLIVLTRVLFGKAKTH
ncbi:MAG: hypothetical protein HZC22_03510 [Rhodocyclales bacterium]|nr:hypothetical protein [Rhodocyclales bacterium]